MSLDGLEKSHFSVLLFYITITFAVVYVTFLLYKRQRKIHPLDLLPGPRKLPFVGNAHQLLAPPTEFVKIFKTRVCIHPSGLTRLWMANIPNCAIYKAKKVEAILSSSKYIDKSVDYSALHPWLGTGLLTSAGSKWHQRRKLLTPSFHFKILEDFMDVFNQQSSKFVSNMSEKADGASFNIFTPITLCTLDIILESAMGKSINAQGNSDSDYVKAVNKITELIMKRQLRPWLRPDFLFKLFGYAKDQEKYLNILHGLSNQTIRDRRKEFQLTKRQDKNKEENEVLGKKKRLAFLDLLLQFEDGGNPLSDEDIREEVDTFMFEGHDTTAAAINWSIYLLGSYPEIQEKVYEELNTIFGDSDRPATSADLREMKYLECCIKEALRIFPSVPFIGRKIFEDVVADGYTIPGGTGIYINKYMLHRDPEYFPEPEEFKPERFFPENSINRHPYAYVPFSAGPRNCIGQKFAMMEEKVVLSSFLRKYRVESVETREELKITADVILRPAYGTFVKIFSRQ